MVTGNGDKLVEGSGSARDESGKDNKSVEDNRLIENIELERDKKSIGDSDRQNITFWGITNSRQQVGGKTIG